MHGAGKAEKSGDLFENEVRQGRPGRGFRRCVGGGGRAGRPVIDRTLRQRGQEENQVAAKEKGKERFTRARKAG
ncbi:hypothetical protein AGMMS50256_34910 [Betaproteobacteria bacterium]|nr:hypothetical protein AGMMS50256_34910 [Betaproteobacteria bacterium]